jgi:uncharacterized protein (DUF983 family)
MMETKPTPNPLLLAMWRGFCGKCPNCGEGRLFGRFLKVTDQCAECGEDYTPQRADDFPAYCVVVFVGHLVVGLVLTTEVMFAPPFWVELMIWLPITSLLSLVLLQPTKGAIVGLQWETGMHGFYRSKRVRDLARLKAGFEEAIAP